MAAAPKKTPFSARLAIFCLIVVGAIFFPMTVLFCGCMLPSFVAAIVDRHAQKTAGVTIGALNLAGTVPAWLELIRKGGGIDQAIALLLQPRILLMAYAAAMLGWALYFYIPPLVAGMMVRKAEKRLKDIEKRQAELVRKFSAAVTGAEPQARPGG
jgi:uncharacterized membrane protein